MTALSDRNLLELWERGANRTMLDRGLLLLWAARPDLPWEALADVPIGARDRALFALREAQFGGRLPALVACPRCAHALEFTFDVSALELSDGAAPGAIEVAGLSFRLPNTRDLAAALRERDAAAARRCLAERCALAPDSDAPNGRSRLDAGLLSELEARLEAADPLAHIALDLCCPDCGHDWQDCFDIVSYLWRELEARARRLLRDVHTLASAYGWSEREVLSLSETRRDAYLAMVLA